MPSYGVVTLHETTYSAHNDTRTDTIDKREWVYDITSMAVANDIEEAAKIAADPPGSARLPGALIAVWELFQPLGDPTPRIPAFTHYTTGSPTVLRLTDTGHWAPVDADKTAPLRQLRAGD